MAFISERMARWQMQGTTLRFGESLTTFLDVWRWGQELERLHARIASHFLRPEPRRRALAFLKGIVSPTERKNGWQLAEHAGESRPDGMQRLLNSAVCYLESVFPSQVSHCAPIWLNVLDQHKHHAANILKYMDID